MKSVKSILIGTTMLCALLFYIVACKKEVRPQEIPKPGQKEILVNTAGRFQDSVSVSSYGFLNFLSVKNLDDFLAYVKSHDHRTVKAYLTGLGFTSRGHSLYGSSYDAVTVTETQSYDYLFNTDYVFEVKGVII
jgi:hypothetical protein